MLVLLLHHLDAPLALRAALTATRAALRWEEKRDSRLEEILSPVERWLTAPSGERAAAVAEMVASLEGARDDEDRGGHFLTEELRMARQVARAAASPDDPRLPLDALQRCISLLRRSPLPFTGLLEIEQDLRKEMDDALLPEVLGYKVSHPLRPTPASGHRWRIRVERGSGHGDLYELEHDIYFAVLDWTTKERVLRFQGESWQKMAGAGGWSSPVLSGVLEVELGPDGRHVLVHYPGDRVERVPIPGA